MNDQVVGQCTTVPQPWAVPSVVPHEGLLLLCSVSSLAEFSDMMLVLPRVPVDFGKDIDGTS